LANNHKFQLSPASSHLPSDKTEKLKITTAFGLGEASCLHHRHQVWLMLPGWAGASKPLVSVMLWVGTASMVWRE
jgi:hypothetical protein